jgi:hypothetical protein
MIHMRTSERTKARRSYIGCVRGQKNEWKAMRRYRVYQFDTKMYVISLIIVSHQW